MSSVQQSETLFLINIPEDSFIYSLTFAKDASSALSCINDILINNSNLKTSNIFSGPDKPYDSYRESVNPKCSKQKVFNRNDMYYLNSIKFGQQTLENHDWHNPPYPLKKYLCGVEATLRHIITQEIISFTYGKKLDFAQKILIFGAQKINDNTKNITLSSIEFKGSVGWILDDKIAILSGFSATIKNISDIRNFIMSDKKSDSILENNYNKINKLNIYEKLVFVFIGYITLVFIIYLFRLIFKNKTKYYYYGGKKYCNSLSCRGGHH